VLLDNTLNGIEAFLQYDHSRAIGQTDKVMTGRVKQISSLGWIKILVYILATVHKSLLSLTKKIPGTTIHFSSRQAWKKLSPSLIASGRPLKSNHK